MGGMGGMGGMADMMGMKGGMAGMKGMGKGMNPMMAMMGMKGMGKGGGAGIQSFIMENGLDDAVANKLMALSPSVQQQVMDGGPLSNANNPSAACMARIKKFSPY
eukprot:gnl/MRDRNA2_/MRDRNA2_103744_c0_seq1.p1 gnl/MRDRNA2_/MRDRNA2_103744_c0~~gnl/MRDRNA2_/MRDRNA2_103744_c0_seq1.p1  ORF type:complete len:105 (+),score=31.60 gnl/MRDRNA2_/MRDRNA2_103744_c0_seq1:2-316(+)